MISHTEHDVGPESAFVADEGRANAATVIDLCCGMGGLSLAARQLGMKVVAGIDTNPAALKTFGRNFSDAVAIKGSVGSSAILRRCAKLLESEKASSRCSVIVSGPPCQGFSAAGPRNPKDHRNRILVAVAEAIAELQPTCALVENVSMVLADKNGERLTRFEEVLTNAGFFVQPLLLDASEFGVAQKRRRAFFLVTRIPLDVSTLTMSIEELKTAPKNTEETLRGLPTPSVRPDIYDDEEVYGKVFNHLAMRHSQGVKEKIAAIPPGKGPMSYRRLHPTRLSNTLFSGHRAPPAHFSEPRSITVREAARLQGFPDDFRIYGAFGNQMEQVTNAVPPPLARAVIKALGNFVLFD